MSHLRKQIKNFQRLIFALDHGEKIRSGLSFPILDKAEISTKKKTLKKRVSKNFDSIDVLVCNAGVFRPKGRRDTPETKDGLERQFQVNFLGHYLLTELIRDKVQNGKVINMMCRSMQNGGLTLLKMNENERELKT